MRKILFLMFLLILPSGAYALDVGVNTSGSMGASTSGSQKGTFTSSLSTGTRTGDNETDTNVNTTSSIDEMRPANTTGVSAATSSDVSSGSANKDRSNTDLNSSFETQSDKSLSTQIQQALQNNPQFSDAVKDIKIKSVNGRVTLEGKLNSEEEIKNVIDQVNRIAGVQSIDNKLQLEKG